VLLEEPSLVCLLVYSHLDMHVFGPYTGTECRARLDTLKPCVAVIFLFRTQVVVLTHPRRRVDTARRRTVVTVAPAKQARSFPATLDKVSEGAARLGLDKQHATDGRARLAWEEEEDGFRAANAAVVGCH